VAVAAATVVVSALAAGCTIPIDDEPQAIPKDALPNALVQPAATSTTLAPAARSEIAILFFTRSDSPESADALVASTREVAVPADTDEFPQAVIEQLLAGPTKEQADAQLLRTAIPDTAQLLDANLEGDVLVLNLANLGAVEGGLQRLAVAQIVFTATQHPPAEELPLVRAVKILQRGQPVTVQVEGRTSNPDEPISRADFPALQQSLDTETGTDAPSAPDPEAPAASPQPADPAAPPP
jgi:spore germination protein GerM